MLFWWDWFHELQDVAAAETMYNCCAGLFVQSVQLQLPALLLSADQHHIQ
jgi:hypothetical protein